MTDNVDVSPILATGDTEHFVVPPGRFILADPHNLVSIDQLKTGNYVGILYQHLPRKRDAVLRENFMRFTCPCGVVLKIHPHEFPTKDLMMPCGNPGHYAIKYEELTPPPEGN